MAVMHEALISAISCSEVEHMGNWFVLAMLAAFGVFSGLWALAGFFLPRQRRTAMVCVCRCAFVSQAAIRRHRWLCSLGLMRCPLIIIDGGMTEEDRHRLEKQGITIYTPEEILFGLEQEREIFERA